MKTLGIVGYGDFGRFTEVLARRFAPELEIKIASRSHAPDNTIFFSLAEVASCDVVVLAIPVSAYEEYLPKIAEHVSDTTLIVDVATVKSYPVSLLQKEPRIKRYLAVHPMFGPYSYEKKQGNVAGFRIVVTDHTLSEEELVACMQWFTSKGFVILNLTADEHDYMLAETLFLTHFIGQTLTKGGFKRTEIDTVSFGFLMDAVESVKHDVKLFHDVYRFNPYCKKIIERWNSTEHEIIAELERL